MTNECELKEIDQETLTDISKKIHEYYMWRMAGAEISEFNNGWCQGVEEISKFIEGGFKYE